MVIRRIIALSALSTLINYHTAAFTSTPLLQKSLFQNSRLLSQNQSSNSDDVSIPYDAAARLEYDKWRNDFNKGDFDDGKYKSFKMNYEEITIANVIETKKARETGSTAKKFKLNKYADMTPEEYLNLPSDAPKAEPEPEPEPESEVEAETPSALSPLGEALKAAQSQSDASSALDEASDALAEEEEKLAKELGLASVEELENALDAMDGIADDGGELNPTNDVSSEDGVRDVYMDWCKSNNKEVDEERFVVFTKNYLAMINYFNENGQEMFLNAYADCTEEEYATILDSQKEETVEHSSEPETEIESSDEISEDISAEEEAEETVSHIVEDQPVEEIVAEEKEEEVIEEAEQEITEEEAKRKKADQKEAERKVAKKKAAEEKAEKKAAEAEAKKKEAEKREKRRAAEVEVKRKAAEEKAKQIAAEQKAAEDEAKQKATQEEIKQAVKAFKQLITSPFKRSDQKVTKSKLPSAKPTRKPIGTKVVAKKKIAVKAVAKERKPFSLFGNAGAGKKKAISKKPTISSRRVKIAPVKRASGTIAIQKAKPATKKNRFFGGSVPQDDIPILKGFRQNTDKSITGIVSNSKNFRNGTAITTSPVRGEAKKGTVVKTQSGSQYRLK